MKTDSKAPKNSPIQPTLLILTPVKNAEQFLERYCELLHSLTYPPELISLAFIESDSEDGTWRELQTRLPALTERFRRTNLFQKNFDFRPAEGAPRWIPALQLKRRTILAKSRNYLLSRALDDEDWVLWIDVDAPHLAHEATGGDVESLAFPLIHVCPNRVAIGARESRVDAHQGLYVVVPRRETVQ